MPAEQVAAFYRDPAHLPEIRYSMILFNWFGVCLVPILALIVLQIRRMAHRTPIFSYAMLGCVAGGPTLFLVANVCWLLAAFRPGTQPRADPVAQRFRLDDLHHPGPVPDRAKRNPCPGNLFRRSAASGLQPLGGPLQPSGGGRAGARGLRRRVIDRPAGVGRLLVLLGEERCHRRLDRRDGRCVGSSHLSRERARECTREPTAASGNWSKPA